MRYETREQAQAAFMDETRTEAERQEAFEAFQAFRSSETFTPPPCTFEKGRSGRGYGR